MTIRTSTKTVSFKRPFVLGRSGEVLPAGDYIVETDEELLEGPSFPAYRRILTLIHLHATPGRPGLTRTATIDPNELDAALRRDAAPNETAVDRNPSREPFAILQVIEELTSGRRSGASDVDLRKGWHS